MHADKYYWVGGDLVRVNLVSPAHDLIEFYNFSQGCKVRASYNGSKLVALPALRIGDVANMMGRKPDTIRKWERKGWIPEPSKFNVSLRGKKILRFYTPKDVEAIRDLISSVHRGRPRKDKRVTSSLISEGNLKLLLRERVKQIGDRK